MALGDLEDRLQKNQVKLVEFKERIRKRASLLDEILKEISNRKMYLMKLNEKDRFLRNRLIRNTEMKSALQNLADIAGYKLENLHETNTLLSEKFNIHNNLTSIFEQNFTDSNSTVTYTRYIEMAYAEVQTMLKSDKLTLIEVIRNLKANELKLKELDKLKTKVEESLNRLYDYKRKLVTMVKHDQQIKKTVNQLEIDIKLNAESKLDNKKYIHNNLTKANNELINK